MAIDDLLNEHEQSERVRTWLQQNAGGLIGGVILGLALIGGYKWWQQHQGQSRVAASSRYDTALQAISADRKTASAALAKINAEPYATLAALQLAKVQIEAGERDAAIATLRAAKAGDADLAVAVQTRLARLLIDAGKAQEALQLLDPKNKSSGLVEVRGDALLALGKRDDARLAYTQALSGLDVAAPARRLLELKLTDVGGSPAKTEK